jgi:hypothetical protein
MDRTVHLYQGVPNKMPWSLFSSVLKHFDRLSWSILRPSVLSCIGFARTRRIGALLAVVVGVDAQTPILTKANK